MKFPLINQIKRTECSRKICKILNYLHVGALPELSSFSVLHDDYYGICIGKNSVRIADKEYVILISLILLI